MGKLIIIKNDDRTFDEYFDQTSIQCHNECEIFKKYNVPKNSFSYLIEDDKENVACLIYGVLIEKNTVEIKKMVFDERIYKELSTAEIHAFLKTFIYKKIAYKFIFKINKPSSDLYLTHLYNDFDYKNENENEKIIHTWSYKKNSSEVK